MKSRFFIILLLLFPFLFQQKNIFSQTYPYNLEIEQITVAGAPALHSFAYAQSGGKWLFIGGRTNGMHTFSNLVPNFPPQYQNKYVWVVDPVTGQSWSRSLYLDLPIAVADPLSTVNMQFYQNGNFLFLTGGYGLDSLHDSLTTFPKVSAINVSGMITAVMNNTNISANILQQTDARFQVTGGELEEMNGYYYHTGGQDFEGEYRDPPANTFTQRYIDRVLRFNMQVVGSSISITNYTEIQDTSNLHRRDMNVVPVMSSGGNLSLNLYGGVFQKGSRLPFQKPVSISNTGSVTLDNSFSQIFSQYNCPVMSVYDSTNHKMHNTFFGGISEYYYDQTSLSVKRDSLIPFIKDISTITRTSAGVSTEYLMPVRFSEYLGANGEFIINTAVPQFADNVINLQGLSGRTFVGYIFGGIRALLPNQAGTSASNRIFKVYITNTTAINPINTLLPEKYLLSQNFPNPFNPSTQIAFSLTRSGFTSLKVFDIMGREVKTLVNESLAAGNYRVDFNGAELSSGIYFYRLTSGSFSEVKKMSLTK